jgi:Peptidase family S41/PDZ domain
MLKKPIFILSSMFFCLDICFITSAELSLKDQMKQDFDVLSHTFVVQYAPANWKFQHFQWNLQEEIRVAKSQIDIKENISIKDFHKIVRSFFQSMKDYHANVSFFSTEEAYLPFQVKGAMGKYYFSAIDRNQLSTYSFPFGVGDELVLFDNMPIADVVNSIRECEVGSNSEQTDFALAEFVLTRRSGSRGHTVPKGSIMITGKSRYTKKLLTIQLLWKYTPEKIINPQCKALELPQFIMSGITHKCFLTHYVEIDQKSLLLGFRDSQLPTLGRVLWQSEPNSPFDANIFEAHHKKIGGFVSIPTFNGDGSDFKKFSEIIKLFEEKTDFLVIDQLNNPGGKLFYLYAVLSLLSDQQLHTPQHRMALTQAEIADAVSAIPLLENVETDEDARLLLGNDIYGLPVSYQTAHFVLHYYKFLLEEWNQDRKFTNPSYIYGIDWIQPNLSVHYTKPILVLINGLDFSCADLFPAILQDNSRATIFGSKTAGAGGYVLTRTFPNLSGIAAIRWTGSLAIRKNGNPIENLGVIPDVEYLVTQEDLQHNYYEYAEAIRETCRKLEGF